MYTYSCVLEYRIDNKGLVEVVSRKLNRWKKQWYHMFLWFLVSKLGVWLVVPMTEHSAPTFVNTSHAFSRFLTISTVFLWGVSLNFKGDVLVGTRERAPNFGYFQAMRCSRVGYVAVLGSNVDSDTVCRFYESSKSICFDTYNTDLRDSVISKSLFHPLTGTVWRYLLDQHKHPPSKSHCQHDHTLIHPPDRGCNVCVWFCGQSIQTARVFTNFGFRGLLTAPTATHPVVLLDLLSLSQ